MHFYRETHSQYPSKIKIWVEIVENILFLDKTLTGVSETLRDSH